MRELESPGSLRWDIRESYASIAMKIGVDEETVRKRIERARLSGIISGLQLIINPHLISRESASLELEVKDSANKAAVVDQIRLMEGVISILDFHGSALQVGIYYKQEKSLMRQVKLMESICGNEHSMLWKVAFPPCDLKMTPTDWRILSILRNDPRRKLSEIAREAKASTRTIKRRLDHMENGCVFFLHAMVDLKKLGGVAYRMLIHCDNSAKKEEVDGMILSTIKHIEWSYTFSDEYSMFVIHCDNTIQSEEIMNSVKRLDGVKKVRMDIIEEQITVQDWINDEIERILI